MDPGSRYGMKPIRALPLALFLILAPTANAGVPHTVQPGETLWTIAAANNFTTRSLAAANGLSEDSQVVLGSTIMIPSVYEASTALAKVAPAQTPAQTAPTASGSGGHLVQPGETLSGIAAANGVSLSALAAANGLSTTSFAISGTTLRIPSASQAPAQAAPAVLGGYKVHAGESLSSIAAAVRVPAGQIAYMNGLDPDGVLLEGTVLKLPTGAQAPESAPPPAQTVVPQAPPNPTQERVDAGTIGQIAAQHGVSPSLASAIAYQESGFNNALVSNANARGVMQILPGTWDWVNHNLAGSNPLNPNSALDNVRGGVLYLRQLLNDFNGDEASAIAAYYQGAAAVKSRGLYDDTKQYVQSVSALRSRFGG